MSSNAHSLNWVHLSYEKRELEEGAGGVRRGMEVSGKEEYRRQVKAKGRWQEREVFSMENKYSYARQVRNGLSSQINIAVIPCMLQNEIYLHGKKVLIQNIKGRQSVHLLVSLIFQQQADKMVIHGIDGRL